MTSFPEPQFVSIQFDIADLPALAQFFATKGRISAPASSAAAQQQLPPDAADTLAQAAVAAGVPERKDQLRRLRNHPAFLKAGIARGLIEVLSERPEEYIDLSAGTQRQKERNYPSTSAGWDMRRYFEASAETGVFDQQANMDSLIGYRKTRGGLVQRKMSREDAAIWRELNKEDGQN